MKKISLIMLAILCLATVASAATITISTTITFTNTTKNLGGNSYYCVNMGDGSQTESQAPFCKGTNGTCYNWTLLAPGVDGCHLIGANVNTATWKDIGEDAATKKDGSTNACTASGSASYAADKVLQVNCGGTMNGNLRGSYGQTYMRQNGGSTYTCYLNCSNATYYSINRGCVTCASATTCAGYSYLQAKCCKCFRP